MKKNFSAKGEVVLSSKENKEVAKLLRDNEKALNEQHKKKPVKRWRFTSITANPRIQFEQIEVTIRIVGPNTYYYQGKKLITDKLFLSKKEAIAHQLLIWTDKVRQTVRTLQDEEAAVRNFVLQLFANS